MKSNEQLGAIGSDDVQSVQDRPVFVQLFTWALKCHCRIQNDC